MATERDANREERIEMEIVVDAYNEEERALGWYYYLDDRLDFPFKAQWITQGSASEEKLVDVVGMSPEEDCSQDMFVEVLYRDGNLEDIFSVRLSDIAVVEADKETQEAIADWHYWVERGYEF